MWPRILIGIILFVGIASAASEYDNIPLETSHSAQRRIGQGPFYTATYGVAPGEYVLRGSDEGEAQPAAAPPQGFSFSQRDQPPPQEYLDLLSQAGVTDTDAPQQPQQQHLQHQQQQHQQLQHPQLQHQQLQHQQLQHQQLQPQQLHQQSVPSRVVDQQFFGVHTRAPYPAAGTQPVSSLKLPNAPTKYPQHERAQPQPLRTPVQSYPSTHNQVAPSKYDSTPLYVTPLPDTVPVSPKKTKPTPGLSSRKTPAVSRTRPQGDSRQGSGKAVQLTYSLDYDLRTLHKDASSAARASPPPAQYSPTVPGKVVKGDERLLRKLAPEPEPLPFPLSRRGNKKSKTKQPDSSSDYDEDDDQKIEVIKLPKNQRPITQEELNELIRAGYDISPVEEDKEEAQPQPRQESTAPQKPQGYPQPAAPLHQLRLPKSRPVEVQAPRYYTSTKTQAPNFNIPTRTRQNAYASAPASATGVEDAGYTYHAPRPLPLEPKVQAYQPGRSGIQDVNKHKTAEQTYQEEDESQTQAYLHDYVNQGYPTSAAPQQPLIPQVQNYPTAAAQVQQQPQYHQVPADQAQLYHQQQVAQQEVQVYQHPGTTESRNEALSQPKEYVLPVPQKPNRYHARGHQGYVPTAPSAAGNDGTLTYHQALVHNQQQGYEQATPVAGVSPVSADEFPQTLPQTFPQTTEGYGRRLTQRKPSSLRESRVTYIRRFQGQTTGYSTEH